jgi:hypothetical protein
MEQKGDQRARGYLCTEGGKVKGRGQRSLEFSRMRVRETHPMNCRPTWKVLWEP